MDWAVYFCQLEAGTHVLQWNIPRTWALLGWKTRRTWMMSMLVRPRRSPV